MKNKMVRLAVVLTSLSSLGFLIAIVMAVTNTASCNPTTVKEQDVKVATDKGFVDINNAGYSGSLKIVGKIEFDGITVYKIKDQVSGLNATNVYVAVGVTHNYPVSISAH